MHKNVSYRQFIMYLMHFIYQNLLLRPRTYTCSLCYVISLLTKKKKHTHTKNVSLGIMAFEINAYQVCVDPHSRTHFVTLVSLCHAHVAVRVYLLYQTFGKTSQRLTEALGVVIWVMLVLLAWMGFVVGCQNL